MKAASSPGVGSRMLRRFTAVATTDRAKKWRRPARRRHVRGRWAVAGIGDWCAGAPFELDLTADDLLRDLDPGVLQRRHVAAGDA